MNRISSCAVWLFSLSIWAASTQSALTADDLADRIAACTRERDDAQRLACFDRAAAPITHEVHKVDADQTFGVQGSELARSRDDDRDEREESAPKRITATVTEIAKRPRGELVFTLDNGQVWAQKDAGAYFPVKAGDPVTILSGTLGSFRLIVANRATAVTRVR
jgi:hypothetical protein